MISYIYIYLLIIFTPYIEPLVSAFVQEFWSQHGPTPHCVIMAPNEPITFPWGKKTDAVSVLAVFASLPKLREFAPKNLWGLQQRITQWPGMFLVLNGMIFSFIEEQVQIISDQLYIWESYAYFDLSCCCHFFQIRNCMLMSWDKKHENLRPFNKTFLLYTNFA